MIGDHRKAKGMKFLNQSLLIENGLAWGMITVVANHVDVVMYWMMDEGSNEVRMVGLC